MQAKLDSGGCELVREPGDQRLSHESTTAYHMKRLLNAQGFGFKRFNPSRHGLTSCRVGLRDRKRGILLWHERYQVEDAAQAFNAGSVWFRRLAAE